MKIYYIFLLLLFVVLPLSAQVNVIPQPNKIEYHNYSNIFLEVWECFI